MTGWLVSFDLLVTVGAYLILAAWLKLPTLATTRAILKVTKIGKHKDSPVQVFLFRLSTWRQGRYPLATTISEKRQQPCARRVSKPCQRHI
ncbi:hypothetical protein [Paenibacillus sp. NPDC055715]